MGISLPIWSVGTKCLRIWNNSCKHALISRIIIANGGIGRAKPSCGWEGPDMELTSLPAEDYAKLEAATHVFWDESELKAKVVSIIRAYNDTMVKAGQLYRY